MSTYEEGNSRGEEERRGEDRRETWRRGGEVRVA
jgi:hypothetical protein